MVVELLQPYGCKSSTTIQRMGESPQAAKALSPIKEWASRHKRRGDKRRYKNASFQLFRCSNYTTWKSHKGNGIPFVLLLRQ